MPDRDRWEIRGPVRTLEIHRTWRYWKRGEGESAACELSENGGHSTVDFRPDGAMARHWHWNPDGSVWTTVHTYDDAGRLIGTRSDGPSGESHIRLYEYDSLGRLMQERSRDPNGVERAIHSYSYDAQGRKTKTQFVDLDSQSASTNYSCGVEGSQAFYSAPNAATVVTNYNHDGRPTELLFHDAAGVLVSRVDFLYDASGHLIEEVQTHTVCPLTAHLPEQLNPEQMAILRSVIGGPIARFRHRYDRAGNKIEALQFIFGSLGTERVIMEYNQYGDLVAQTSDDQSREYGLDDQGQLIEGPGRRNRSEARFLYEYDERGNWTSKITEARNGDESDFAVTSADRRTLAYFDPI